MDAAGLLVFAVALFVAAASPGPAITALVARVLVRGNTGALAFMAGLAIGDVVWLSAAVLGLAVIAHSFAVAFLIVKYLGAAYLLYLAWRMWTAPVHAELQQTPAAERPMKLFAAGLSLTLGNPKTMVFYLALLPNLIDLTAVGAVDYGALAVTTLAVVITVDGGYVLLAARARRLLANTRAIRVVNRSAAALMAGAAVAVATR